MGPGLAGLRVSRRPWGVNGLSGRPPPPAGGQAVAQGSPGLRACCALSANGVQDGREWGRNPVNFPQAPNSYPVDDSASELRKRNLVNKPVDISNDFPMDYQTIYAPMIGHSPRMRAVRQSIEQ